MSNQPETADQFDQEVQADADRLLGLTSSTTRACTSIHHGQVQWFAAKMYRIQNEKSIIVAASSFNYGRAEKATPFEMKTQTLSEYNKDCTQFNENVPLSLGSEVLSPTAQASMVQKYFGSATRPTLKELSPTTLDQYIRDTSGLLQIDDQTQMRMIIQKTIHDDTFSLICQMCTNLPLQGEFWLSTRQAPFSDENELYLDISTLSMHRFQQLLALVRTQLASSSKGKPTSQIELAKAKACDMID